LVGKERIQNTGHRIQEQVSGKQGIRRLPRPFGPRNDEALTSVFRSLTSVFWPGANFLPELAYKIFSKKLKKYLKFILTVCR
jgi:hypothetical protein